MATWPATLPSSPLADGFNEQPPNLAIRTDMDAGPAKVRRRFTAGVRPMTVMFLLTKAQVATLDEFYTSTLSGGTIRFDWTHPRTGSAVEFRFTAPPEYRADSDLWQVTMSLEIMP